MPEQVTVIITETTPGGGSRFYQEPGRPSSVDVDSLTPNTEYRADAEYEAPDGTTIRASNSMTFRTLPIGMFSISNPNWQNDNDGQHSTFTFDYTSTYALSYAQVVDMATGVTYQGTIVGSSVTAQLPAGTAGTQHNFQLIIADIYGYSYVQGYVMTLEASMAETPFYIEAENPSVTSVVRLYSADGLTDGLTTMEISYDKSTWTQYYLSNQIILNSQHQRVYFKRSISSSTFSTSNNYYYFTSNEYISVGGNISSLKDPTLSDTTLNPYDFQRLFYNNTYLRNTNKLYLGNYTTLSIYCYLGMFNGCTALTQAPTLPATKLGRGSYYDMFSGCTSLTQAPALPATTLATECYRNMFNGCTGLVTIPSNMLPAMTMANGCYYNMFRECTSLTNIPSDLLPAATLANNCYRNMFKQCTSLTQAPALPATTVYEYCYASMFEGCTSLTQAPILPATTLADYCYQQMFEGCTSLTQAPILPATSLAVQCYISMFSGCTSLTTLPSGMFPVWSYVSSQCCGWMFMGCTSLSSVPADLLPTDLSTAGTSMYNNMFEGCTSLTAAPDLRSPQIRSGSQNYHYMFSGCISLSRILCLLKSIPTNSILGWTRNVAATGTFIKDPSASWPRGDNGIPSGWTVVDYQN